MPPQSKTRRRLTPGPVIVQREALLNRDPPYNIINSSIQSTRFGLDGIQVTVSEGHQWPPSKGPSHDQGGEFVTSLSEVLAPRTMPYAEVERAGFGNRFRYYGPFLAFPVALLDDSTGNLGLPDLSSSDDDLDELGATAIARCEPTKSASNLQTALAETLREGLPSLLGVHTWKNRADGIRKNTSSEYLNYQFGIAPLISDIQSVGKSVRDASKILSQFEKDSGKYVRRKYYFPMKTDSSEIDLGPNQGSIVPYIGSFLAPRLVGSGKVVRHREVVTKQWFSGAFTYFIDEGNDFFSKMHKHAQEADKLLGISLSPETIWNLTPWSWATDWFANTGDVIHNLEAFKQHGLIMRYGYMMETTIITDTYSWRYDSFSATDPSVADLILRRTIKKRRPANPFGFGVQWSGLSPFQLSITAALGLNKGRR